LFEAITWALFGRARRTDDALINSGMDGCQVALEFDYEGERYRVEREKSRGKGTSLEFQILDSSSGWRPLTETGIRATEERIRDVLRLDYDTFVNASFFLQGKADLFAMQTAGKRKEILSSILGLEVWEQYREEAARRRRAEEQEVDLQQSLLAEVLEELGEEAERRLTLENIEELLQKTSSLRESKSAHMDQVRMQAQQIRADEEKINLYKQQADALALQIKEVQILLEQRKNRLSETEKFIANENDIEQGYQIWQKLREALSNLDTLGAQYHKLNLKKAEVNGEIQAAAARLEQEQSSLLTVKAEIEIILQEEPVKEDHLQQQIQKAAAVRLETENLGKYEAEIDELKQKRADVDGENKQLSKEMDKMQKRLENLEGAKGAQCPLCGQPLNSEHKQHTLNNIKSDGKGLGDRFRQNKAEMARLNQEIARLQNEIITLKRKQNELALLENEVAMLRQGKEERSSRIEKWSKIWEPRLKEIKNLLDNGSMVHEKQVELKGIQKEIADLAYEPDRHDKLREEERTLRKMEVQFRELQQSRTALEGLRREIAAHEARARQLANDLREVNSRKGSLEKGTNERREMLPDISALEEELRAVQREENELRLRLGGAKQSVDVLEVQRRRKGEIENGINEVNRRISRLKTVETTFGKDGIPALLIEQSIPQIETQANEILDRLSSGDMSVNFRTERAYADKKRKDKKQTLDIEIHDSTGTREYELFSGGEAFRINFAIRLALSRVLAQRFGARLQTLVIDEGFGSQDAEGRQRLVEAINLVSDDFEKILVITHLEELKDAFPSRIEVTKTLAGSNVEVIA